MSEENLVLWWILAGLLALWLGLNAWLTIGTRACVEVYGLPEALCTQVAGTPLTAEEAVQLHEAFPNLSNRAWDSFHLRLSLYGAKHPASYVLDPARRDWPWNSILQGHVWPGMTDEQAAIAWGRPTKINRTITTHGVREQWVYSGDGSIARDLYRRTRTCYLYFENGILTAIQD